MGSETTLLAELNRWLAKLALPSSALDEVLESADSIHDLQYATPDDLDEVTASWAPDAKRRFIDAVNALNGDAAVTEEPSPSESEVEALREEIRQLRPQLEEARRETFEREQAARDEERQDAQVTIKHLQFRLDEARAKAQIPLEKTDWKKKLEDERKKAAKALEDERKKAATTLEEEKRQLEAKFDEMRRALEVQAAKDHQEAEEKLAHQVQVSVARARDTLKTSYKQAVEDKVAAQKKTADAQNDADAARRVAEAALFVEKERERRETQVRSLMEEADAASVAVLLATKAQHERTAEILQRVCKAHSESIRLELTTATAKMIDLQRQMDHKAQSTAGTQTIVGLEQIVQQAAADAKDHVARRDAAERKVAKLESDREALKTALTASETEKIDALRKAASITNVQVALENMSRQRDAAVQCRDAATRRATKADAALEAAKTECSMCLQNLDQAKAEGASFSAALAAAQNDVDLVKEAAKKDAMATDEKFRAAQFDWESQLEAQRVADLRNDRAFAATASIAALHAQEIVRLCGSQAASTATINALRTAMAQERESAKTAKDAAVRTVRHECERALQTTDRSFAATAVRAAQDGSERRRLASVNAASTATNLALRAEIHRITEKAEETNAAQAQRIGQLETSMEKVFVDHAKRYSALATDLVKARQETRDAKNQAALDLQDLDLAAASCQDAKVKMINKDRLRIMKERNAAVDAACAADAASQARIQLDTADRERLEAELVETREAKAVATRQLDDVGRQRDELEASLEHQRDAVVGLVAQLEEDTSQRQVLQGNVAELQDEVTALEHYGAQSRDALAAAEVAGMAVVAMERRSSRMTLQRSLESLEARLSGEHQKVVAQHNEDLRLKSDELRGRDDEFQQLEKTNADSQNAAGAVMAAMELRRTHEIEEVTRLYEIEAALNRDALGAADVVLAATIAMEERRREALAEDLASSYEATTATVQKLVDARVTALEARLAKTGDAVAAALSSATERSDALAATLSETVRLKDDALTRCTDLEAKLKSACFGSDAEDVVPVATPASVSNSAPASVFNSDDETQTARGSLSDTAWESYVTTHADLGLPKTRPVGLQFDKRNDSWSFRNRKTGRKQSFTDAKAAYDALVNYKAKRPVSPTSSSRQQKSPTTTRAASPSGEDASKVQRLRRSERIVPGDEDQSPAKRLRSSPSVKKRPSSDTESEEAWAAARKSAQQLPRKKPRHLNFEDGKWQWTNAARKTLTFSSADAAYEASDERPRVSDDAWSVARSHSPGLPEIRPPNVCYDDRRATLTYRDKKKLTSYPTADAAYAASLPRGDVHDDAWNIARRFSTTDLPFERPPNLRYDPVLCRWKAHIDSDVQYFDSVDAAYDVAKNHSCSIIVDVMSTSTPRGHLATYIGPGVEFLNDAIQWRIYRRASRILPLDDDATSTKEFIGFYYYNTTDPPPTDRNYEVICEWSTLKEIQTWVSQSLVVVDGPSSSS